MPDIFDENRRALDTLIDSMPHFTRYELTEKYRESCRHQPSTLIGGGGMTIPSYLEDLREAKVLGFRGGIYYHLQYNG